MASGRSSGGSGPEGRRPGQDPYRGLANLGEGPAPQSASGVPRGVANEGGLRALGHQIEGRPPRRPRRGRGGGSHRRPRWSRRKKVLTTLSVVIVLLLIAVGGSYAYLRYDFGQVTKIACSACAPPANDSITPFNVLIIGSDTRAGNTGQAAQSFGTQAEVGGQRSDTIKILHVDPTSKTAELLSIPRDTWVEMSGLPASSGLSGPNKINTAYNNGPVPLVQTIENTFGIPLSHFVVVDFTGLINAVQSVGGINLHFTYPVRDYDPETGYNNSGLDITTTGCITLNGGQVLALARSRYFEYDDPANGGWSGDPTSDLGRIERQNLIIDALMQKVESTYNPLTLKSFLDSVVHDIAIDRNLGLGELYSLASTYHAFSSSKLKTYTLPTTSAQTEGGADIEVVEEPEAQQMLTTFLGTPPEAITTPPLDEYSDPISVPAGSGATPSTSIAGAATTTSTTSSVLAPTPIAAFDPTPC